MTAAAFQACLRCGATFQRRSKDADDRWEKRKYCSRKCARAANVIRASLAERIKRASMPVTESGCWLWLGALHPLGYADIKIDGKMVKAHRASWVAYRGTIPDGLRVLHRCDVRCCVNPDHLFLGTQTDNMRDMVAKGRRRATSGENNPNSKLTSAEVEAIRQSVGSHVAVAQRFGVSKSIIGYIRSGQNWKLS